MNLEEKDKYIEEHLMALSAETLRFMVADHVAEIEQLRVQLAGCGVVAMCNTETSRAKQKCEQGDYGWSQSYQDVANAVDREIKLRHALDIIHDYTVRNHGGILGRLHEICDTALGHEK